MFKKYLRKLNMTASAETEGCSWFLHPRLLPRLEALRSASVRPAIFGRVEKAGVEWHDWI
jgi:hypothetical protein